MSSLPSYISGTRQEWIVAVKDPYASKSLPFICFAVFLSWQFFWDFIVSFEYLGRSNLCKWYVNFMILNTFMSYFWSSANLCISSKKDAQQSFNRRHKKSTFLILYGLVFNRPLLRFAIVNLQQSFFIINLQVRNCSKTLSMKVACSEFTVFSVHNLIVFFRNAS